VSVTIDGVDQENRPHDPHDPFPVGLNKKNYGKQDFICHW